MPLGEGLSQQPRRRIARDSLKWHYVNLEPEVLELTMFFT
jgi:hypothetical protein